ncbi:hypothetical protein CVT25_012626 [Psilocybe cyanescens]|uniref:Uncharacterized protein n=1 Tax=Psilocybe cyanescens TaxID=93625 RepID=A0A409WDB4_PSICY|nr:hypothetical protein CVT25_012626 [Psilocybe cyanescens]
MTLHMYGMYRNTYSTTTAHTIAGTTHTVTCTDDMHGMYCDTYDANGCMHNGHENTYDGHDDDDDMYNNHNGQGHIQQPQHMRQAQRPQRRGQQHVRWTHTMATTHATGAAATKTRTTTRTVDTYHGHNNGGTYDSTNTFGGGYDRYDHPPAPLF